MTDDDRFDNPFCNELASFLSEYEALLASKGFTKIYCGISASYTGSYYGTSHYRY